MSQDWTDDVFAGGHAGQTDLANMEKNFQCLKTCFSGSSAPSNPSAGMWWFDTNANILKLRNEANDAWLSVWDLANNKPVIVNLSNEITGTMIAAALKSPAAGTEGLRKLGTGATDACAGNDSRLSDNRTPADGSVTIPKGAYGVFLAGIFSDIEEESSTTLTTYQLAFHGRCYIPASATTIQFSVRLKSSVTRNDHAQMQLKVGSLTSAMVGGDTTSYDWYEGSLDVSSISGWQTWEIYLRRDPAYAGTAYVAGLTAVYGT